MKRAVLLLALPSLLAPPVRAEIIERIVAKVNGEIITLSDFETRQLTAVQVAGVEPSRVPVYLRANNARILQEAIDEALLLQKADLLGFKLPASYLDEVIGNIKKENKIDSDAEFLAQLQREGLTMDDLRRNIEHSIMRRQLLSRELEPKVAATDAEARAGYEERRTEWAKPATVKLEEIVVSSKGRADAKADAQDLVKRARGGEEFAVLARERSAATTAASGGDLGSFAKGELSAALEKEVFSLPVGGITEPIPVPEGYRILRVADRSEGRVVPFEEVRMDLRKKIEDTKRVKVYEEYMVALRKDAVIDILVSEVPLQLQTPGPTGPRLDQGIGELPAEVPSAERGAPRGPSAPSLGSDEIETERRSPLAERPPAGPTPPAAESPRP